MEIYFIDRKSGERKKEIVFGDQMLQWMYGSILGQSSLELLVKKKLFSSLYGRIQDTSFSRKKIASFVEQMEIDMKEAEREELQEYRSFNDFFARTLKKEARPICQEKDTLIAPADGRILTYDHIDMEKVIQVKGSYYTLEGLFQDKRLADQYDNGICIVVRLCPADYHRFHFPDSGRVHYHKKVKGKYYSVNPVALKKVAEIYCQNKREITLFQSDNFGQIALIEVGATCVGSIIQTYQDGKWVKKGEEKGYFKFGGSTVIMFLEKNKVKIDEDILRNSEEGIETKINMGERIGRRSR